MKSCAALLLTVIVIMLSTSAEAVSIVNAEATLDWTGFAFTTTGTLAATMTTKGDQRASTSAIASGSATAAGSATNGFVILSAGAVATAPALLTSTGRAILNGDNVFWFTGTGVGSLVVTIPYHLEISSSQTSNNDFTSANASVELFTGPGVGSSASDALSLTGAGAMSRDGVLNVSLPLVDPTSGALVAFFLQSEVNVSAAVPEETNSALLLSISLLVIGAFGRRWALGA
jgi:hypothetical protein